VGPRAGLFFMNCSQVKKIEKDETRGTCKVHGQMRNE